MSASMTVRCFELEKDYADIGSWWRAHGWPVVPIDHLPPVGIVAEQDGVKLCAVWLYVLTPVFWASEWLVTNPNISAAKAVRSIKLIVSTIREMQKTSGVQTVWTSLKHEKLARLFIELGFVQADSGVSHFISRVT